MASSDILATLAKEPFLALTTFRRSGQPVATPIWVGRDGDTLVVMTAGDSAKVKRLRNNPRVELRPCNPLGRVPEGAITASGTAQILSDNAAINRLITIIRNKYGLQYWLIIGFEWLANRGKHRDWVILRITLHKDDY